MKSGEICQACVIDATAVGVGELTQTASSRLRVAESGHAQHYGLIMAAGVLLATVKSYLAKSGDSSTMAAAIDARIALTPPVPLL